MWNCYAVSVSSIHWLPAALQCVRTLWPQRENHPRSLWDNLDGGKQVCWWEVMVLRCPTSQLGTGKSWVYFPPPAALWVFVSLAMRAAEECLPPVFVRPHGSWPNLTKNMKGFVGKCHFQMCFSPILTLWTEICFNNPPHLHADSDRELLKAALSQRRAYFLVTGWKSYSPLNQISRQHLSGSLCEMNELAVFKE